jgi:hypothetical protein
LQGDAWPRVPDRALWRLFLSVDILIERNTLMQRVCPKIKECCHEGHGLEFQVLLYEDCLKVMTQSWKGTHTHGMGL